MDSLPNLNIDWANIIAIISAVAAVASALFAYNSNKKSKEANQISKEGNMVSKEANERTMKLQFEIDYNDFIRIIPKYKASLNKLIRKYGTRSIVGNLRLIRGSDISGDIIDLIEVIEQDEKSIKIPIEFEYIIVDTHNCLKNIKFKYNLNRGRYNPTEDLENLIKYLNNENKKIEERLP